MCRIGRCCRLLEEGKRAKDMLAKPSPAKRGADELAASARPDKSPKLEPQ